MSALLKFTQKAEHALRLLNNSLRRKSDNQFLAVEKWYSEDPHSLKRSTFDYLDESSVVFDLGGYEGQWTSDIYSRYRSQVYVFEPVKEYASLITSRFKKNNDIRVFDFGLGHTDQELEITIDKFASSVVHRKDNAASEKIRIKNFLAFVEDQQISRIDLVKINIEGSEFDLLEYLLSEQFMPRITGILVQFHNFAPRAEARMRAIKSGLQATHDCVFEYNFVWEYWKLR